MKKMSLSPVDTFGGLMNDLLNGCHTRLFRDDFFNEDWTKQHGQVPVNISETDNGYSLDVVAPGVKKEDLKVEVNDNLLTISFEHRDEKKEETKENDHKVLRQEFSVQSFKRTFDLGEQVDAEKISAKYDSGVLHLNVPKKEQVTAANKVIEIA